jgi:hypothetical protein
MLVCATFADMSPTVSSSESPALRDATAKSNPAVAVQPQQLTGVEVEILVRLLGYGCSAEKAAIYLDLPVTVVREEIARLGLQTGAENGAPAAPRRMKTADSAEKSAADVPVSSKSGTRRQLESRPASIWRRVVFKTEPCATRHTRKPVTGNLSRGFDRRLEDSVS